MDAGGSADNVAKERRKIKDVVLRASVFHLIKIIVPLS